MSMDTKTQPHVRRSLSAMGTVVTSRRMAHGAGMRMPSPPPVGSPSRGRRGGAVALTAKAATAPALAPSAVPAMPSMPSTPALYLSNWVDLVAIWRASLLTQTDTAHLPCITELHYLGGPTTAAAQNQIVDYTGFFRDESAGITYDKAGTLDAQAWFESEPGVAGTVTSKYIGFAGGPGTRLQIERSFAAVPHQPFLVVRYTLTNPTNAPLDFNLLDQVHLDNVGGSSANARVKASYDQTRNALFADMTASGQFFVVLGALQPMDSFQVGDESVTDPTAPTAAAWHAFDTSGKLASNPSLTASDVDLAFQKRLTVAPGASQSLYLYITVRGDLASARAAADAARARTGADWFAATADAYTDWLTAGGQGRRLGTSSAAASATFDRSLILMKNCQHPKLGTFPATTNPFAYGYKNWARDASVTAMSLDASGHADEAALYWRWMASVQNSDGSWATTYSYWDGSYMQFVEPEYDSIGAFMYGVWRHYELTGDATFLADMEPAVGRAATFVLANLQPNGFGAADFSIWEEPERGLESNAFTQAWYVAGTYAAQKLYEAQGRTDLADWYAGGPASILTAIQRPFDWQTHGLWNEQGYYIRAVNADQTVHETLHDSSSNVLFALGVLDSASQRTTNHVNSLIGLLTHERFGLARYENDEYYDVNPYDPAQDEAHGESPIWPQMSNWMAICEDQAGEHDNARARLEWYTSVTGAGYTPPGEAVSYVTRAPIPSSMSEPLTAASFVLAALVHEGQLDLRITPPVYNAGAYQTIQIAAGAGVHANGADDAPQWQSTPYFTGPAAPAVTGRATAIKRVYLANDDANLYLRVDNQAESLPPNGHEPKFALRVYAADLLGAAPTGQTGLSGRALPRPVSLVLERKSDSPLFQRATLVNGRWSYDAKSITSVEAPQWNPASGRIEAILPLAALTSGVVPPLGDTWVPLVVVLAQHDAATDTWADDGLLLLHYRLTSPTQAWIFGNIEQ